jgi:hypothetical protein
VPPSYTTCRTSQMTGDQRCWQVTTSRTARRTGGVGSYSCPALIINVPNFSFLIRYIELWASVTCGLNYLQATSGRYAVYMGEVLVAMCPKSFSVAGSNIVPSQRIETNKLLYDAPCSARLRRPEIVPWTWKFRDAIPKYRCSEAGFPLLKNVKINS